MRAISTLQGLALASRTRASYVRVLIDRGGGDWVDMTTLGGVNWIAGVEWGENIDKQVAEATLKLYREDHFKSLSPFVDDSEMNALGTVVDVGNSVKIYADSFADGTTYDPLIDLNFMFSGTIESVDWEATPISVRCLDKGTELQSPWIETQQKYPVDPATTDDVEDIMQDILDDHGGSVVLWSINGTVGTEFDPGDSPGWVVTEYIQKKEPVLSALTRLASMIGWDLRYKFNTDSADFELTFYEPDRAAVASLRTFGPSDYLKISKCRLSREGIRNAVRVTYTDTTGLHTSVLRTDAASIAKYGRRFMEIVEASSSQIDTATEANAMADACVADLCEPSMDKSVEMPFFWPVELGDLYTFEANGVHYDTDQKLAVVGYRHVLDAKGMGKTTLQCRGKPAGGFKRWLTLEARAGIAPSSDLLPKEAPTGVGATAGVGSITIVTDDPRGMSPPVTDWLYTNVYLSTANPCTATPGNLRASGRTTRFDITGLVPGQTYYSVTEIIDGSGNVGTTSAQVSVATEMVAGYHTNPEAEPGPLNLNSNFGQATANIATTEPDCWEVETGTWGDTDGEWYTATTPVLTGGRCLKLNSVAKPGAGMTTRTFIGDPCIVETGGLVCLDVAWRHDGDTGNRISLEYEIDWLDASKAYISKSQPVDMIFPYYDPGALGTGTACAANVWYIDRGWFIAPATAVYAQVRIASYVSNLFGQARHPEMFFAYAVLTRSLVKLVKETGATNRAFAGGIWVQPWLETSPNIDNASGFTPGIAMIPSEHVYAVPYDGEYFIDWTPVYTTTLNAGYKIAAGIMVNAALVAQAESPASPGAIANVACYVATGNIQLSAGDAITFVTQHNDTVNRTVNDAACKARIFQVSNRMR